MPRKDKQAAQAHEEPTHAALHHQKMQLVNAFTELASSMRKAAHEAEVMATTVANTNLSEGSRAALQKNATEMLKAVQAPVAALAAKSPKDDIVMAGVVPTNPKKRPHPSVAERKSVDAAIEDTVSPEVVVVTNGKKGKEKKERKPKVPRDPNMPKKPPSAYLLFQNERRASIKEKHPEFSNHMLLQELSRLWSAMPEESKAKYQAIVDEQKIIFNDGMKEYNLTKGTNPAAVVAAPAAKLAKVVSPTAKASPDKPIPAKAAPVAPAPVPTARQPVPTAATSTTTDDDEESGSESGESSSGDSEEEEEEEEEEDEGDDDEEDEDEDEEETEHPPPAKKHKSQAVPPPTASVQRKKGP
ncbi:hypothetical protein FRB96_000182 [Tulasnella sp. 330]|nr:hypothetical protein FRB96_000182 [Tulasnella sp. 330]KAG8885915.1 hypothetical protein FRB97_009077 [Tulasnella sp. 331]